jgi:hypothetical protein
MSKASAYGDEIWQVTLYHKTLIGCSFHSNRSRGLRGGGVRDSKIPLEVLCRLPETKHTRK